MKKKANVTYGYISIVAIVAIAALFVIFENSGDKESYQQPIVLDRGNIIGDARYTESNFEMIAPRSSMSYVEELIDAGKTNNEFKINAVFDELIKNNAEVKEIEEIERVHGRVINRELVGDHLMITDHEDGSRWFSWCFCWQVNSACHWTSSGSCEPKPGRCRGWPGCGSIGTAPEMDTLR